MDIIPLIVNSVVPNQLVHLQSLFREWHRLLITPWDPILQNNLHYFIEKGITGLSVDSATLRTYCADVQADLELPS